MPVDNLWINCEVSENLCTRNELLNGFIYCGPMPIVERCWAYARAQRLCARTDPFRSGQLCPVPRRCGKVVETPPHPPADFLQGMLCEDSASRDCSHGRKQRCLPWQDTAGVMKAFGPNLPKRLSRRQCRSLSRVACPYRGFRRSGVVWHTGQECDPAISAEKLTRAVGVRIIGRASISSGWNGPQLSGARPTKVR